MVRCKSQAGTKAVKNIVWPFWLQVCDAVFIPFIVWWSFTPTDVLNFAWGWKMLERVGLFGATLIFFTGVLFGIIGLVKARKMNRLRILTRVLAIVNMIVGVFLLALFILMIVAVAKGV